MVTIEGYIINVRFRSDETGYTVMDFESDGEKLTAVGTLNIAEPGMTLALSGDFVVHANYGEQFAFTDAEEIIPKDTLDIERYLGSGAIKGIGIALASRIVTKFGEDTLRILDEEPERLAEIKGISNRKAAEIAEQVREKRDLREAMMFLQKYGISLNLAVKIYSKYNIEVYRILRENPYKLADEIDGVGFKKADEIAFKIGINVDSDFRIRSGINYVLLSAGREGHTYLPKGELIARAMNLLMVGADGIEAQIDNLVTERKLVYKDDGEEDIRVYSAYYYYVELSAARDLVGLKANYKKDKKIDKFISDFEKEKHIELDELQKEAISYASYETPLVVTGGPGTGKTTIINAMIRYFEENNLSFVLAAPTGRAAKRMSEVTGYVASTIHRLLEMNVSNGDKPVFMRDDSEPLDVDVIIIDEMSMVDIQLFNALVKAIIPGTRLIMVGDAAQLPSVGPGAVLADIIESEAVKVVKLKHIFRQEGNSAIVENAHAIIEGREVSTDNKTEDFFMLKRYDSESVIPVITELWMKHLPKHFNVSPLDIQILTPTRIGNTGVENLNIVLQQFINPPSGRKEEYKIKDITFREGDKVMQIKNNYDISWYMTNGLGFTTEEGKGVFNGDIGIIEKINKEMKTAKVLFDDSKYVYYSFEEMSELELAYAVTVHKSQGTEYPAVIIPLLQCPKPLMNRNLLYTAVTRASKCVALVGDEKVFQTMIDNKNELLRYSGFAERIREVLEN